MSGRFHLAQVNLARLKHPIDAPQTAEFRLALERINALAEASEGFIWRLTGEGADATDVRIADDARLLINLSVWCDAVSLAAFVYRGAHAGFLRRRQFWFEPADQAMALWWIAAGHRPTPAEAIDRLDRLRRDGPGPLAFTFRDRFPAPGEAEAALTAGA